MSEGRTTKAIRNMKFFFLITIIQMVLQFINRSFMIANLNKEIIGINGLFLSLINMISLNNLGIPPAIMNTLYRPLHENDFSLIRSLLEKYKRLYHRMAVAVFCLSIVLFFILPFIVRSDLPWDQLTKYYFLFVADTLVSYLFIYNSLIIQADQRSYITKILTFYIYVGVCVLQIISLVFFQSFTIYLIIQLVGTIATNFITTLKAYKDYPKIFKATIKKVPEEINIRFKKNSFGNIVNRLSSTLNNSLSNVVITRFIGLSALAILSNYQLIITNIQMLINQMFGSIVSSIGNLSVTTDKAKAFRSFCLLQLCLFSIVLVIASGMLSSLSNFIELWVGKSYVFSSQIVLLLVVNFVVISMRTVNLNFISAYGLGYHQRVRGVIEMILNISICLILVKFFNLKIVGVLLAILISQLLITSWYEPMIVFRHALKSPFRLFFNSLFRQILNFMFVMLIIVFLPKKQLSNPVVNLTVVAAESVLISVISIFIFWTETLEFKDLKNRIQIFFFKKKRKI